MIDLKPGWINLGKRCQSAARREHGGYTVMTIIVMVDQDGAPLIWVLDKISKLEPKSKCHVLLEHFG